MKALALLAAAVLLAMPAQAGPLDDAPDAPGPADEMAAYLVNATLEFYEDFDPTAPPADISEQVVDFLFKLGAVADFLCRTDFSYSLSSVAQKPVDYDSFQKTLTVKVLGTDSSFNAGVWTHAFQVDDGVLECLQPHSGIGLPDIINLSEEPGLPVPNILRTGPIVDGG